jgi:transposase
VSSGGCAVPYNFRPVNRDQRFLLPEDMRDWVSEDHLAHVVIDAVQLLDLRPFLASYRADGQGAAAFHPQVMLTLLIYAYCDGERFSRRIEQHCRTDAAYRLVVANQIPDHSTIARFRARHETAIGALFTQVLRLCLDAGLGLLSTASVDGTKMPGPASLRANRTSAQIDAELAAITAAILAEAKEADESGDALFGDDPPNTPTTRKVRGMPDRRQRLQQARQRLDAADAQAYAAYQAKLDERADKEVKSGKKLRGRKPVPPTPDPDAKANITDPESRILKGLRGYVQGLNAQAVAAADHLVLAADVVADANDVGQLHPMLERTHANLRQAGSSKTIGTMLGDAGYFSQANLEQADPQGPQLLIAVTKEHKTRRAARDTPPVQGPPPHGLSLKEQMEHKLSTPEGRAAYAQRGATIEPIFGQHKHNRRMPGFLRAGQAAADSEWKLINFTGNLTKLYRAVKSGKATVPWTRLGSTDRPVAAT